MLDTVTGEIINVPLTPEKYALMFKEHYVLSMDVFRTVGTPATGILEFEDLQEALNIYLLLFFHCDWVRDCTLTKHDPHVPKLFTVCKFKRTKEFKNFLPLPLDKPTFYYYNKATLVDLWAKADSLYEEKNILEV